MKKLLHLVYYKCSTISSLKSGNQPYFNFLNRNQKSLSLVVSKIRSKSGTKIHVPFNALGREQVKQFFQQHNLRQKNILLDIDSSHWLGIRRLLILQHLKKNVYKGIQQPISALSQSNPQYQSKLQQLFFDDDIFFMTDPKFIHLWQTKQQDQIDSIVQQQYDNNIDRGVIRLKQQYKIPSQFLYIFQTAHNFDNKIYFGGINQYDIRNILWLYYTVDELKNMFVGAMHYWKRTEKFLESQNKIDMMEFNEKCRQYIHQENYHLFQPYRYNRLKLLAAKIGHCYTFAHSYAFQKADMSTMNLQFGKQHAKATESDKIQKHAILQVMLGNLWGQQYSNNKFPYLSESYNKLNQNDKHTIDGIYNKHCNIYKKAIEKFRDKHFKEIDEKSKQKARQTLIQ